MEVEAEDGEDAGGWPARTSSAGCAQPTKAVSVRATPIITMDRIPISWEESSRIMITPVLYRPCPHLYCGKIDPQVHYVAPMLQMRAWADLLLRTKPFT